MCGICLKQPADRAPEVGTAVLQMGNEPFTVFRFAISIA